MSNLQIFSNIPLPLLMTYILLISLCVGSFLNVVIFRLAVKFGLIEITKSINFLRSRSLCPQCHHQIAWYDNVPLLSFLLLRGHCRHCQQKISWQYPLIELSALILGLGLFLIYGLTFKFLALLLFCWWLIPLAILDLKYFILPNELTLSLLIIGIIINISGLFTPLFNAVIGAAVGYGLLAVIDGLYYLWRKQHGMGQGDWKLLAAIGAWFGWQTTTNIMIIASLTGALIGILLITLKRAKMQSQLPFGVFLVIAALIEVLFRIHL